MVFLLDVSRSMLAADALPNRLARAKAVIGQLAAQARGDRLGLVAFAGSQAVACPLTVDHSFFREMLDEASPASVARGGTLLGDAISFALERAFDDVKRDSRTLVIVSDGEDHDSAPEEAARAAAGARIRMVSIGIGSLGGAQVPTSATDSTPFQYQGATVISRLDPSALRRLGNYVDGNTALDAAAVYARWIGRAGSAGATPSEAGGAAWAALLAAAILLLAAEPTVRERRAAAAIAAAALLLHPAAAMAQTVEEWFGRGAKEREQRHYQEAIHYFADAAAWSPAVAEIRFNLAKVLYLDRSWGEAALSFEHTARIATDPHLRTIAKIGQGNSLFRDATTRRNEPALSMTQLHQAIEAYRAALRIEPDNFTADVNLKVAERRLRDLLRNPSGLAMDDRPPSARGPLPDPRHLLRQPRLPASPTSSLRQVPIGKDW
jgi:Ca-activated chloride channel family protein